MNLMLHLPPSLEEPLKHLAAQSGLDIETYVIETVKSQVNAAREDDWKPKVNAAEFRRKIEEMIALHPPLSGHVDDSRESIYD